ncbi:MAG: ferredoxin family protein [Anaerolineae bacterium]|nr:ferredoxin family protein [Anaerolineae bacterium]MDW8098310.1 ferredoxin family protein [Anaerolineae bacterium]
MIDNIDPQRCIGCKLCVKVCPLDILRMKPDGAGRSKAVIVYREECQSCFLCEIYCPTDAIYVGPERSPLHAMGSPVFSLDLQEKMLCSPSESSDLP